MESVAKETSNTVLREQRLLRGWSLQHVADEIHALCQPKEGEVSVTANMVGKWERGLHKPSPLYREKLCRLYGLSAIQLGFIDTSSSPSSVSQEHVTIEGIANKQLSPLLGTSIIQESESSDMNKSRRKILGEVPHLVGATFISPTSYDLLNISLLERLSKVLTKPSSIDQTALKYLKMHTARYWQDRNNAVLASSDLLGYVLDHLQKVVVLLEGSLLPSVRIYLCSTIGEITLLVSELLFDMSEYAQARNFYKVTVRAAQEANNPALESVAWGRMSFTYTYSGNPQAALTCIQEARRLAINGANTTVCAWLAAVEAEIWANLGNAKDCNQALHGTDCVEDQMHPKEDCYWIHFDLSLLSGYKGVCFLRLHHSTEAQSALQDALNLLDSKLTRRRPNLLTDLAGTYIQQGEVEQTCETAVQAAAIIAQIKSPTVLQRLITARYELEPWKDTSYVKNLDQHYLKPLLTSDWFRGNL